MGVTLHLLAVLGTIAGLAGSTTASGVPFTVGSTNYYAETSTTYTFCEAAEACATVAGPKFRLASFELEPEAIAVRDYLLADSSLNSIEYWIGARRNPNQFSQFRWVASGVPMAYSTFWAPGEPNNGGANGESCATVSMTVQKFNDFDCEGDKAFICEEYP